MSKKVGISRYYLTAIPFFRGHVGNYLIMKISTLVKNYRNNMLNAVTFLRFAEIEKRKKRNERTRMKNNVYTLTQVREENNLSAHP